MNSYSKQAQQFKDSNSKQISSQIISEQSNFTTWKFISKIFRFKENESIY